MKTKRFKVCGMCAQFSFKDKWCNGCGQLIVAPTPSRTPTLTGMVRHVMDKACGQFVPKGPVEYLEFIDYTKNEEVK